MAVSVSATLADCAANGLVRMNEEKIIQLDQITRRSIRIC